MVIEQSNTEKSLYVEMIAYHQAIKDYLKKHFFTKNDKWGRDKSPKTKTSNAKNPGAFNSNRKNPESRKTQNVKSPKRKKTRIKIFKIWMSKAQINKIPKFWNSENKTSKI